MNNKHNNKVFVCPDNIKNIFLYFSLFELLFIIFYFIMYKNFNSVFVYYPLYLSKLLLFLFLIAVLFLLFSNIAVLFFAKEYTYNILKTNIIYIRNKDYIFNFTDKKYKLRICFNLYITIFVLSSILSMIYIKAGNILLDELLYYIGVLNIIIGISYIIQSLLFFIRVSKIKNK